MRFLLYYQHFIYRDTPSKEGKMLRKGSTIICVVLVLSKHVSSLLGFLHQLHAFQSSSWSGLCTSCTDVDRLPGSVQSLNSSIICWQIVTRPGSQRPTNNKFKMHVDSDEQCKFGSKALLGRFWRARFDRTHVGTKALKRANWERKHVSLLTFVIVSCESEGMCLSKLSRFVTS